MEIRLDHVGIVVDDLDAVAAFFVGLGLEAGPARVVADAWLTRVVGLPGPRVEVVMVSTADGLGRLELVRFITPNDERGPESAPPNRHGIRHIALAVDDIEDAVARVRALGFELVGDLVDYQGVYKLCYVRGPEGILVELAQGSRPKQPG